MIAVLRRCAPRLPGLVRNLDRPASSLRLDLPLADTVASRFLVWIVAALTCGAMLSVGLVAASDGALHRAVETGAQPLQVAVDLRGGEAELAQTVETLRGVEGVAEIRLGGLMPTGAGDEASSAPPVPPGALALEVWPTETDGADDALQSRLHRALPGAVLLASKPLAEPVAVPGFLRALGVVLALACVGLGLAVAATVTRMSLDLHQGTVDLLRLMGAPDRYVARQFEHHAWASGARGGVIGFAAGLVILLGLAFAMSLLPEFDLRLDLRWLDWLLLAAVPAPLVVGVGLVTRYAARRALARLR